MDIDLMKWLDAQAKKKIFRERNHGIELCVSLISRLPEETLIRLIFSPDKVPVFLSEIELKKLENLRDKYGLASLDEAIRFAVASSKL